jgi:FHA domain-containing protein
MPPQAMPAPAPIRRDAQDEAVARPAAPAVAAPMPADVAALLQAFQEGLGVPTVRVEALTPALMRLIGELLHEATRGTVDLLIARAALKREVRAEATMIVARENNPLKFSPSAEVALGHLLAPPMRGFMDAAPAMRDAFDDLRAHQIGFLAGMRAALEGLLENFDPARLEGRLERGSGLKSLLPGSRQARSWEIFTQRYAEIRAEAQDDFHSLFGKAFLQAYEAHIDQLKSGDR